MIAFHDFVPEQMTAGGWLTPAEYESFEAAVAAANQWLAQAGVRVLGVETVVLPNLHSRYEEGSTDPALRTHGDMPSSWHQFVRVWYEMEDRGKPEGEGAGR